jgi:hypothetical protein
MCITYTYILSILDSNRYLNPSDFKELSNKEITDVPMV